MTPPARNFQTEHAEHHHTSRTPIIDWYSTRLPLTFDERIAAGQSLEGSKNDDMIDEANPCERPRLPEASLVMTGRSHTIAASEISSCAFTDRSSQIPPLSTGGISVSSAGMSASTGMASALSGFPLLDPEDGTVVYPPPSGLECAFSFRGCAFLSEDIDIWKTHCFSHFFPHPPPNSISCPLCDFRRGPFATGNEAWNVRLDHIALRHHKMGYSLAASRPDFDLFRYLMQKKLITNEEYKDLMSNGGRPHELDHHTTDNVSHSRRRR